MAMSNAASIIERALRGIDRKGLTVRDGVVLKAVLDYPGCCGQDIQLRLGFANRSAVAGNLHRLIKRGLVEDRRTREAQAVPSIYHPTDAGIVFWHDLMRIA